MKDKKRKVSFYLLTLEKNSLIKDKTTTLIKPLKNSETEEHFKMIYKDMNELKSGNKAKDVSTANNDYVIEIISYTGHTVFAKIGQQNSNNTVALRDKKTLETEEVPMSENQLLELYTYCLIDFETGIISYIGINGAPKISAIRELFNGYFYQTQNIEAKLSAIMTDDILQTILRKQIVSKLSLSIAIPNDKIFSEKIGLSDKDFDSIIDLKTKTATFKLVASRNKNIFKSSKCLAKIITDLKEKYGTNLNSLTVSAKNDKENSESYDLLHYCFTKTVILRSDNPDGLNENDFKNVLAGTYRTNKEDLLKYIR